MTLLIVSEWPFFWLYVLTIIAEDNNSACSALHNSFSDYFFSAFLIKIWLQNNIKVCQPYHISILIVFHNFSQFSLDVEVTQIHGVFLW